MILSPYRNPPYRSPTKSPETPKRKRDEPTDMDVDKEPPQIETQLHFQESTNAGPAGENSPRTKVADKFKDLEIHAPLPALQITEAGTPRKRLKRRTELSGGLSRVRISPEADEANRAPRYESPCESTVEVEETPDAYSKARSSPPSSPVPSPTRIAYVEITSPSTPPKDISPHYPPSSPTSHLSPSTPSNTDSTDLVDRSVSPLPSKTSLTPDQAALTWQEAEITGHEIDPNGDDDGEGINGIGFRPTPAIAAARQHRRRQQVSEWKAREAREARQRRMDRRRGAGGTVVRSEGEGLEGLNSSPGAEGPGGPGGRMVRFVGVGQ